MTEYNVVCSNDSFFSRVKVEAHSIEEACQLALDSDIICNNPLYNSDFSMKALYCSDIWIEDERGNSKPVHYSEIPYEYQTIASKLQLKIDEMQKDINQLTKLLRDNNIQYTNVIGY